MDVLIIGGTRFVGHYLATSLLELGYRVTVFRRGVTPDTLPPEVERITGDRTEPGSLARSLDRRTFDTAVDMIAMRGPDTREAIAALAGRVDRFIHISTGQVYLVREGCPTTAREEDYEGPLTPPPPASSWEHREWLYGEGKRECEDVLIEAWQSRGFPSVRLRMPIIHGSGDPSGRLQGYLSRLADGGPLLVPKEHGAMIRHVYAADVVAAIMAAMTAPAGRAYNVASNDFWTHKALLDRLGELVGVAPQVVRFPRGELVEAGIFPSCAPFTTPWMSVLDTTRSKAELGLRPAGFDDFLPGLVQEWRELRQTPSASFFEQRAAERRFVEQRRRS